VAAGIFPLSVAVAPDSTGKFGRFAYVANFTSRTVSMFSINADGTLTTLGTTSVGGRPVSVAVHPSGKFAYVACTGVRSPYGNTSVSAFAIDSTTGALTPTAVEISGYNEPRSIAVDPSGNFAILALRNQTQPLLNIWSIDPVTGALPGPDMFGVLPVANDAFTLALANHPSGTLLAYVASGASTVCLGCPQDDVVTYALFSGSTFNGDIDQTVDAGAAPTSIALDPSGKFAYVGNSGSANISMYRINADGTWVPLGTINL
jgi:6-phosphogluconolactonase (cycloisomerase 2 family)